MEQWIKALVLSHKPWDPSLIFGTYRKENQLPQAVLWPLHMHCTLHIHACIPKHITCCAYMRMHACTYTNTQSPITINKTTLKNWKKSVCVCLYVVKCYIKEKSFPLKETAYCDSFVRGDIWSELCSSSSQVNIIFLFRGKSRKTRPCEQAWEESRRGSDTPLDPTGQSKTPNLVSPFPGACKFSEKRRTARKEEGYRIS